MTWENIDLSLGRRLDADQYREMILAVKIDFVAAFGYERRFKIVESYSEKESFGDISVILEDDATGDYRTTLARALGSPGFREMRRTTAFMKEGVVVNVTLIAPQSFDYAVQFKAFNDMNGIISRIASKMGLKHSVDGLKYFLNDGGVVFAEITLTTDFEAALKFLGYDLARYRQGFKNLDEIFEFVVSTSFFNPDLYDEKSSFICMVRQSRRKTFNAFLNWLKSPTGLALSERCMRAWFDYPDHKSHWVEYFKLEFSHLDQEIAVQNEKYNRYLQSRQYFNTHLVMNQTGLNGRRLATFVDEIKTHLGSQEAFADWVLQSGKDAVQEYIKNKFEIENTKFIPMNHRIECRDYDINQFEFRPEPDQDPYFEVERIKRWR